MVNEWGLALNMEWPRKKGQWKPAEDPNVQGVGEVRDRMTLPTQVVRPRAHPGSGRRYLTTDCIRDCGT